MKDGVSRREFFAFWRRKGASPDAPDAEPPGRAAGGSSQSAPAAPSAAAAAPAPEPPPAAAIPEQEPLRPPGAIMDELLVDTCSRCGKCVEACPRHAILPLDDAWGTARGTPAIVPRFAPCVVCEGIECTRVCPTGALVRIGVTDIQMGTAIVARTRCVTWQGQACDLCVTSCPVPGAIARDADGHPLVDEARCVGCGVCEHVCPTPQASIVIVNARVLAR